MGIRMLYRRTAPVPAHAVGASTPRIPVGVTARLRSEPVLRYLALVLTLFPRSRPMPTMTVFVATEGAVSGGAGRRPPAERPVPGPGATA